VRSLLSRGLAGLVDDEGEAIEDADGALCVLESWVEDPHARGRVLLRRD
jgi:hypothetical protein